ncbi:MAG TPA: glycosyltransferase family 4 protein [Blastocatellia bacterium]|nr:glycosyltransferase family 4 protein [Blastocatellia bacterium]
MNILYHSTLPPPIFANSEALLQEITLLRNHFGGQINILNPMPHGSYISWRVWGLHQFFRLRKMDRSVDLHHVFCAGLFPFPVMRTWRKPVVYTITAGLEHQSAPPWRFPARTAMVVSNQRDAERLIQWGFSPQVIPPVIDVAGFSHTGKAASPYFTLLMASAPWTPEQFSSKGIDTLLEVVRREPGLRLVLLWRGMLFDEINGRVRSLSLEDRVEIINREADVNQLLSRVNATVFLSSTDQGVKAWPHSLIESLAAGKPVILSKCIPMADYVTDHGCGVTVNSINVDDVTSATRKMIGRYETYQRNALLSVKQSFTIEEPLKSYLRLYESQLHKQ